MIVVSDAVDAVDVSVELGGVDFPVETSTVLDDVGKVEKRSVTVLVVGVAVVDAVSVVLNVVDVPVDSSKVLGDDGRVV